MHEQLLGYLMDALEPRERQEVEKQLRQCPEWQRGLDQLRIRVEPLSWDGGHHEPPAGLARRTCDFIAQRHLAVPREFAGRSLRWSAADYLVAASVVLAASLLLIPAMGHSRTVARIAQCQNNLRQIGAQLISYSDANNGFLPYIPPSGKLANSSAFGSQLVSAGMLPDPRLLFCPNSVHSQPGQPVVVPTTAQVERAEGAELQRLQRAMGGDYRSTLGYMQGNKYFGTRYLGRPYFAYLADAPHDVQRQSMNHDRCGQNVLFEDGHVQFLTTCRCMPQGHPDDIFANSDGQIAPGTSRDDSVIAPGQFALPVTPVAAGN